MQLIKLDKRMKGYKTYSHKIQFESKYYYGDHDEFDSTREWWAVVRWFEKRLGPTVELKDLVDYQYHMAAVSQPLPDWSFSINKREIFLREKALTLWSLSQESVTQIAQTARKFAASTSWLEWEDS